MSELNMSFPTKECFFSLVTHSWLDFINILNSIVVNPSVLATYLSNSCSLLTKYTYVSSFAINALSYTNQVTSNLTPLCVQLMHICLRVKGTFRYSMNLQQFNEKYLAGSFRQLLPWLILYLYLIDLLSNFSFVQPA